MDIKDNALQALYDNIKILGVCVIFYEVKDGMIVRYEHEGKSYTPPEFLVSAVVGTDKIEEGKCECARELERVIRNAIKHNNIIYAEIQHVAVSFRGSALSQTFTDGLDFDKGRVFISGQFSACIVKKVTETSVVSTGKGDL